MGAALSGEGPCCNCWGEEEKTVIVTEIRNQDWADAVLEFNLVGIQFLHQMDPDLVNYPVDLTNGRAIHYAINGAYKMRNAGMMQYLLENGAEVDVQAGVEYDSALHKVVKELVRLHKARKNKEKMEPLWECVRLLFCHGIKEDLKNNDKIMASELVQGDKRLMKKYNNMKKAGTRVYEDSRRNRPTGRRMHTKQASALFVAGMDLDNTHETTIKRYVKETDDATKTMKDKLNAVSKREIPETQFGEDCGIDPDEIAVAMQQIPDLGKVWHKCTKGHDTMEVSKQTEIFKILYSLTVMVSRKKNPKARRPPQDAVKKLTIKLSKKFPRKKGKLVLEKQFFVNEFYKTLYELHEELKLAYEEEKYFMRPGDQV